MEGEQLCECVGGNLRLGKSSSRGEWVDTKPGEEAVNIKWRELARRGVWQVARWGMHDTGRGEDGTHHHILMRVSLCDPTALQVVIRVVVAVGIILADVAMLAIKVPFVALAWTARDEGLVRLEVQIRPEVELSVEVREGGYGQQVRIREVGVRWRVGVDDVEALEVRWRHRGWRLACSGILF